MVEKHPYVTSPGPLVALIGHLRKTFPAAVTAKTLKQLNLAPQNESYIINTLSFIGVIDGEGKKTEKASKIFAAHNDGDFQKTFSEIVEKAYSYLFDLHKDAWTLNQDQLITFFRRTDLSSDVIGRRQAQTFKSLAALSGHGDVPESKPKKVTETAKKTTRKKETQSTITSPDPDNVKNGNNINQFGLTVRIEINLPAEGNQDTYDKIFKSIRENLING